MSQYNTPSCQQRLQQYNGIVFDPIPPEGLLSQLENDIAAAWNQEPYFDQWCSDIAIVDDVNTFILREEALLASLSGEDIHWSSSFGLQLREAYQRKNQTRIEVLTRTLRAYVARKRQGQNVKVYDVYQEMVNRVAADEMVAQGRITREKADAALSKIGY